MVIWDSDFKYIIKEREKLAQYLKKNRAGRDLNILIPRMNKAIEVLLNLSLDLDDEDLIGMNTKAFKDTAKEYAEGIKDIVPKEMEKELKKKK